MAEPGLAQRLRRHSRNSGMMIGVSMAAAMIICIAAFIWLYVQIGPLLSDFIPQETAEEDSGIAGDPGNGSADPGGAGDLSLAEIPPEPVETPASEDDEDDEDDNGEEVDEANDTGEPSNNQDEDAEEADPEEEWTPTHQLRDGPNVNFRSGPNTISEPQGSLPPGTPLLFLGDEEPASGVVWMFFETEDGTEGWIRDIDVIEVEPDDESEPGSDDEPDGDESPDDE